MYVLIYNVQYQYQRILLFTLHVTRLLYHQPVPVHTYTTTGWFDLSNNRLHPVDVREIQDTPRDTSMHHTVRGIQPPSPSRGISPSFRRFVLRPQTYNRLSSRYVFCVSILLNSCVDRYTSTSQCCQEVWVDWRGQDHVREVTMMLFGLLDCSLFCSDCKPFCWKDFQRMRRRSRYWTPPLHTRPDIGLVSQ